MRLTCFSIVLALVAGFLTGRAIAQIPERVMFQPGSFAHGYQSGVVVPGVAVEGAGAIVGTEIVEAADNEADEPQTEFEAQFGEKAKTAQSDIAYVQVPSVAFTVVQPPYLAWHRCPWTGRIHLIPYQPGYAMSPEEFPTHQSKLNLWLSSLPCRKQNRPQQEYLSHYDPMPPVLTDKPSRRQLLLGYGDPNWTVSCCNSPWRDQTAHCPGVDPINLGPSAELRIVDQCPIHHGLPALAP